MKKVIAIVLLTLTSIVTFGQSFEGKIVYANTYKSKNPKITDQQWGAMMGTTQEFLIKGGDYKSITNGTLIQWQLYINKDNKVYNKLSNSEAATWIDAGSQNEEILKVELNKNVTEILGYKCDELIFTCKSGIQKFYFNSKLAVDPKLFSNHKFANWYDYLLKANAMALKSIIDNVQFTFESTAIEVKPTKLDAKIFELPLGIKTEKSAH